AGPRAAQLPAQGVSAAACHAADCAHRSQPRLSGRALAQRRAGRLERRHSLGRAQLDAGSPPATPWSPGNGVGRAPPRRLAGAGAGNGPQSSRRTNKQRIMTARGEAAMEQNQRIILVERPQGMPDERHLKLESAPIPTPGEGQVLLKTIYLSLDPYMRGRMSAARSYAKPVEIGEVMEGGTVSQVVASRHPDWKEGDIVLARSGWQLYALSDGEGLRRLDPDLAPISTALGVLGMPGFTAYVGLLELGQPKEGETVVVSAASGAVGSVVGQIAKIGRASC